jgi:hypothetical protein
MLPQYRKPRLDTACGEGFKDGFGLSCALATPLASGDVGYAPMAQHVQKCLGEGCGSVTVFATSEKAQSFGFAERVRTSAR